MSSCCGPSSSPRLSILPLWACGLYLGVLTPLSALDRAPQSVLAWIAVFSLISFATMGLDKRAAARGARRTPENMLHLLELLGGWPGSALAQHLFRHKTQKTSYQFLFRAIFLGHLTLLGWIVLSASGRAFLFHLNQMLP